MAVRTRAAIPNILGYTKYKDTILSYSREIYNETSSKISAFERAPAI